MIRCSYCQCSIDSCICGDVDRSFAEDQELTFGIYEERELLKRLPRTSSSVEELDEVEGDEVA